MGGSSGRVFFLPTSKVAGQGQHGEESPATGGRKQGEPGSPQAKARAGLQRPAAPVAQGGGLVAPEDRKYRKGAGMYGQVRLVPWTVLRAAEDAMATTHALDEDTAWQVDARAEKSALVEEARARRNSAGERSGVLDTVLSRRGSLTDDRRVLLRAAVDKEAGRMGVAADLPHLDGARTAHEAAHTPSMRSFRRSHETHSEATRRTRAALAAMKARRAAAAAARAQPSLRERAQDIRADDTGLGRLLLNSGVSEAVRAIMAGAPFDAEAEAEGGDGGSGAGGGGGNGRGQGMRGARGAVASGTGSVDSMALSEGGAGSRPGGGRPAQDPLEVARAAIEAAQKSRGMGQGGSVALGGAGSGQDPLERVDVRLLAAELDVRARAEEVDDEAASARARGEAGVVPSSASAMVLAAAAEEEGPGVSRREISGVALRRWLAAFERGMGGFASPVLYAESKLKEAMALVRQTARSVPRPRAPRLVSDREQQRGAMGQALSRESLGVHELGEMQAAGETAYLVVDRPHPFTVSLSLYLLQRLKPEHLLGPGSSEEERRALQLLSKEAARAVFFQAAEGGVPGGAGLVSEDRRASLASTSAGGDRPTRPESALSSALAGGLDTPLASDDIEDGSDGGGTDGAGPLEEEQDRESVGGTSVGSAAEAAREQEAEHGRSQRLALGAAGSVPLQGAQKVFGWTPHFALARRLRTDVRHLQVEEATQQVDRAWMQEELGRRRQVFNTTVRHWQSGILASCFRGWVRAVSHEKAQKRRALRFFRNMHGGSQDLERKRFVFGRWRANGAVNRTRKARAAEQRAKTRRDQARRQVDVASDALRELQTKVRELDEERGKRRKKVVALERELGALQDESEAADPESELQRAMAWVQVGRLGVSLSVGAALRYGRWVREGVGASAAALEGGQGAGRWVRLGHSGVGQEKKEDDFQGTVGGPWTRVVWRGADWASVSREAAVCSGGAEARVRRAAKAAQEMARRASVTSAEELRLVLAMERQELREEALGEQREAVRRKRALTEQRLKASRRARLGIVQHQQQEAGPREGGIRGRAVSTGEGTGLDTALDAPPWAERGDGEEEDVPLRGRSRSELTPRRRRAPTVAGQEAAGQGGRGSAGIHVPVPAPGELLVAGMRRMLGPSAARRAILDAPAVFQAAVLPRLMGSATSIGAGSSSSAASASRASRSQGRAGGRLLPPARTRNQTADSAPPSPSQGGRPITPGSVRGATPSGGTQGTRNRAGRRPFREDSSPPPAAAAGPTPSQGSAASTQSGQGTGLPPSGMVPRIRRTASSQETARAGSEAWMGGALAHLTSRQAVAAARLGTRMGLLPDTDPSGSPVWARGIDLSAVLDVAGGSKQAHCVWPVVLEAAGLMHPGWRAWGMRGGGKGGGSGSAASAVGIMPSSPRGSGRGMLRSLGGSGRSMGGRESPESGQTGGMGAGGLLESVLARLGPSRGEAQALSPSAGREELEGHHATVAFFLSLAGAGHGAASAQQRLLQIAPPAPDAGAKPARQGKGQGQGLSGRTGQTPYVKALGELLSRRTGLGERGKRRWAAWLAARAQGMGVCRTSSVGRGSSSLA